MTDKPTYSYSRLNFYLTCPYGYNRKYNCGERGDGNWFSDVGSLVHQINDDYYTAGVEKGLTITEIRMVMILKFVRGWDLITSKPPAMMPNIKWKRFDQIIDYLSNFIPDLDMDKVEEHIEWTLSDGTKMQCYIDEQVKYKVGAKKTLVGDIKSTYKREYDEQLNTYCLAYKAKNGQYPNTVYIRQYTDGKVIKWEVTRPRKAEIKDTESKLIETVRAIESDTEWKPKGERFFCQNLCGFRNSCKFAVK